MGTDKRTVRDGRSLLPASLLLLAVFGTLVLGAVLRIAPEPPDAAPPLDPPPADAARIPPDFEELPADFEELPAEFEERAAIEPAPAADLARLALRARDDARRLSAPGEAWTLQFMVTRRAETAERLLRELGHDPELHLLPVRLDDEPCFRICWGSFASRESAATASTIPPALIALNREPIPRPIADLIP
jgi:septal ring-binding cell division protein DamX